MLQGIFYGYLLLMAALAVYCFMRLFPVTFLLSFFKRNDQEN